MDNLHNAEAHYPNYNTDSGVNVGYQDNVTNQGAATNENRSGIMRFDGRIVGFIIGNLVISIIPVMLLLTNYKNSEDTSLSASIFGTYISFILLCALVYTCVGILLYKKHLIWIINRKQEDKSIFNFMSISLFVLALVILILICIVASNIGESLWFYFFHVGIAFIARISIPISFLYYLYFR